MSDILKYQITVKLLKTTFLHVPNCVAKFIEISSSMNPSIVQLHDSTELGLIAILA